VESLSRISAAVLDVLEVLLTGDDELYGLKIAELSGLKTGTVYPILARLAEVGWVDSHWEREERGERGPRRRFYRFNPEGLAAARAVVRERRPAATRTAALRPRPAGGLMRRRPLGDAP
jgi:PadR family transcriptional regulator PadR